MKLVKIHKIMKFIQTRWMEKYIEICGYQRKISTSSFDKDFFKLMMNSIFGKTMENVRHQRSITFMDSMKKAEKLIAMPTFKNVTIFREDLIAIERRKVTCHFNKPIYSGFSILDISKVLMYDFHYNFIKPKHPGSHS